MSSWRVNLRLAGCLAVMALAGCASTPAEDDPVQLKLTDLETRLARIERVLANQSLLELSNQIEALRADVRGMHNEVDISNNASDLSRRQARDLYGDLDQRVKSLESRSGAVVSAGSTGAAASGTGAAADGADKAQYQAAFSLLKDSKYDAAIVAFQKFLTEFPTSTLADNAQYWLGEAFYVNKAFPDAQAAFQLVLDKYPQSRKIPDALLKIGFCRYELKQFDAARETLAQVTAKYPDTPAARLAQQRLEKMALEKH